jgi:hypothetical protein
MASLGACLRERREEIEQTIATRVMALSRPAADSGLEYADGLRAAIGAGIEYAIAGIEGGEVTEAPPVPAPMLAQARLAARSGVGLDTVLRRYLAGHALLGDFLLEEAEGRIPSRELKRPLRRLAAAVDRVLTAVSAAYTEEAEGRRRDAGGRRAELIERLLAGEPLDAGELGYDLDAIHLGLLAAGPGAANSLRDLARSLDARLLSVQRREGTVWGWIGRRERLDFEDARRLAQESWSPEATLALGEPEEGSAGWRLTHHQARAAFPIAQRRPGTPVRYTDVALLAAMLRDDLLATSLRRLYLEPLSAERDGGATLRETLSAYYSAERNVASTAAALGVSRQTISSRLKLAEERVGPLGTHAAEIEAALRFWDLGQAQVI